MTKEEEIIRQQASAIKALMQRIAEQELVIADLQERLRTCPHKRPTPSGRVFSQLTALILLEIHPVFLRRIALSGGKIPRPAGIVRL